MVSKIIRRTHLYLALFFMPWMLIYAISTMAMNHRDWLHSLYSTPQAGYALIEERTLDIALSPDIGNKEAAQLILRELGMDGAHNFKGSLENDRLVINRQTATVNKRITYTPSKQSITIEAEEFRMPQWLEKIHRRRGYGQNYAKDDVWAFGVDLVILAMLLWALTGLWMGWEVKAARRWGIVCLCAGTGAFLFFLFTI